MRETRVREMLASILQPRILLPSKNFISVAEIRADLIIVLQIIFVRNGVIHIV